MPTVNNNTPTLRFPEFKEEWELKKLGKIAKVSSGGTPSRAQSNYWNGNIPWVSTTLIDFNTILESNEFITNDGLANSSAKLFPKGTLLMAMYGQGKTRGKVAILGIEATTNQACGAIVPNNDKLNELFLFQNLAGRYDEIRDLSNQGGQENLSGEIIKNILITLPTLPEQQKIVTFLTAVDEKLQALKQKKNLLEQYKKGVMQKIFSQELRFKDDNGNAFADWEEKKLGEILEEKNEKTKASGQHRILSSTTKGIFNQDEYFTRDIASKDNTGYKILRKFQLVFSPQNLWLGNINVNMNFEIGIVSPSYKIFSFIKKFTTAEYCEYFLLTPEMMFEYEQSSVQGASVVRRNLDLDKFLNIEFNLPTIEEQTKIATFLSTIDEKINQCQAQITNTEVWKKGLLQGMFI